MIILHSVDEVLGIVAYIYLQSKASKLISKSCFTGIVLDIFANLLRVAFLWMFCARLLLWTGVFYWISWNLSAIWLQFKAQELIHFFFHRYTQHSRMYWFGIRSTWHSICSRYLSLLVQQQQNKLNSRI